MKAIIDRKKWLRGDKDSYLLREFDGRMCCLGQLGLQCGLKETQICNVSALSELGEIDNHPVLSKLVVRNTEFKDNSKIAYRLMGVNDNKCIDDQEREKVLTNLFKEIDVEVEFIN